MAGLLLCTCLFNGMAAMEMGPATDVLAGKPCPEY
jgi:hypothetical protein